MHQAENASRPSLPFHNFPLGQIVMAHSFVELLGGLEAAQAIGADLIGKHATGDFGSVAEDSWVRNLEALNSAFGGRIMSAYEMADNKKVWVITEADRSVTTILLPSDY